MLTTSRPATRTQNPVKADIWKRRIIKYFDLLSPEDQEDIKQAIADKSAIASQFSQPVIITQWPFANDKVWHLGALIGEDIVSEAVSANGGQLTSKLIIDLLTIHPLPFYIDANESILFLGNNKLAELELGPLKPISSVEAVQRYGLAKLEEASEKSYTRV